MTSTVPATVLDLFYNMTVLLLFIFFPHVTEVFFIIITIFYLTDSEPNETDGRQL